MLPKELPSAIVVKNLGLQQTTETNHLQYCRKNDSQRNGKNLNWGIFTVRRHQSASILGKLQKPSVRTSFTVLRPKTSGVDTFSKTFPGKMKPKSCQSFYEKTERLPKIRLEKSTITYKANIFLEHKKREVLPKDIWLCSSRSKVKMSFQL